MLDALVAPPVSTGSGGGFAHSVAIASGDAAVPRGDRLPWLEQAVIALARHDPASSIKEPGRFSRFLPGRLPCLKLANPRLEALRRYVIQYRRHSVFVDRSERERMIVAGYDLTQIHEIERLVASPPRVLPKPVQPPSADKCGPSIEREAVPTINRFRPHYIACMGIVSLALVQGTAHAQDWSTVQQQGQSASSDNSNSRQSEDHIIVGLGAGYAPAYQGAKDYRAIPLPAIDIAQGRFFANLRNGIGIYALDTGMVKLGVSATYMPGYRSKDVPDGIGKLNIGLGARAFASVNAYGVVATVGATKGVVGGNKGVVADLSLSYPVMLTPRLTLIPTVGTTWADGQYNRRYFGVDAVQSFASGLSEFQPGSGFKDASAILTASYRLTDHVVLSASGGATTLLGDVKNSPLVYHRTQPSGFLSVAYSF